MTRLVAKVSCEEAIKHLSQQLVKLGYTWKIHTPGVVRLEHFFWVMYLYAITFLAR